MPTESTVPREVYRDAARARLTVDCDGGEFSTSLVANVAQDEAHRAVVESAFKAGRKAAAQAIVMFADEHHPKPDQFDARRYTARQHFLTAARVAQGPASLAEVAEALRRGDYAACHLDEAGRPIPPEERP
jgi:hypothetical protein